MFQIRHKSAPDRPCAQIFVANLFLFNTYPHILYNYVTQITYSFKENVAFETSNFQIESEIESKSLKIYLAPDLTWWRQGQTPPRTIFIVSVIYGSILQPKEGAALTDLLAKKKHNLDFSSKAFLFQRKALVSGRTFLRGQ